MAWRMVPASATISPTTEESAGPGDGMGDRMARRSVTSRCPAASGSGHAADLVAGTAAPEAASGGVRMLVVDDDAMIADMAARFLGRRGHSVITAYSAESALERFAEDPDGLGLLITDLTMPGMGGLALATRVRERRPDLPVILSSGGVETEIRLPGPGRVAFLQKPHTLRELMDLVQATLGGPAAGAS
jgi:CheY-like chemotaxis protein